MLADGCTDRRMDGRKIRSLYPAMPEAGETNIACDPYLNYPTETVSVRVHNICSHIEKRKTLKPPPPFLPHISGILTV